MNWERIEDFSRLHPSHSSRALTFARPSLSSLFLGLDCAVLCSFAAGCEEGAKALEGGFSQQHLFLALNPAPFSFPEKRPPIWLAGVPSSYSSQKGGALGSDEELNSRYVVDVTTPALLLSCFTDQIHHVAFRLALPKAL